jgi:RNA-binding protein
VELSEKQRKFLRGKGHGLAPLARLGNAGVTGAFLAELDRTLSRHELVKVKVNAGDRVARDAAIRQMVTESGASLVTRIGHVAVLYRPAAEPRIILPAD